MTKCCCLSALLLAPIIVATWAAPREGGHCVEWQQARTGCDPIEAWGPLQSALW